MENIEYKRKWHLGVCIAIMILPLIIIFAALLLFAPYASSFLELLTQTRVYGLSFSVFSKIILVTMSMILAFIFTFIEIILILSCKKYKIISYLSTISFILGLLVIFFQFKSLLLPILFLILPILNFIMTITKNSNYTELNEIKNKNDLQKRRNKHIIITLSLSYLLILYAIITATTILYLRATYFSEIIGLITNSKSYISNLFMGFLLTAFAFSLIEIMAIATYNNYKFYSLISTLAYVGVLIIILLKGDVNLLPITITVLVIINCILTFSKNSNYSELDTIKPLKDDDIDW